MSCLIELDLIRDEKGWTIGTGIDRGTGTGVNKTLRHLARHLASPTLRSAGRVRIGANTSNTIALPMVMASSVSPRPANVIGGNERHTERHAGLRNESETDPPRAIVKDTRPYSPTTRGPSRASKRR